MGRDSNTHTHTYAHAYPCTMQAGCQSQHGPTAAGSSCAMLWRRLLDFAAATDVAELALAWAPMLCVLLKARTKGAEAAGPLGQY